MNTLSEDTKIVIPINPRKTLIWLAAGIVMLVSMHVVTMMLHSNFDNRYTSSLFNFFGLDNEGNLPTYFSAGILAVSAFLFLIIAKGCRLIKDSQSKWWYGLFLCFVYLSLDEALQIHEKFNSNTLLSFVKTSGLLAWAWVIPYGIIAIVFSIIYLKFWLSLPGKYRIMFAACAGFYVMAAIGFEMLGAREYDSHQEFTTLYDFLYTIEEAIEMSSIAALIFVLLSYISDRFGSIKFSSD